MSVNIKIILILSILLLLIPDVLAADVWVLKETKEGDKVLCEESDLCKSPSIVITESSVEISLGWIEGECSGRKQLKGSWTTPPATLVPGEKIKTNLESSVSGSTSCEGYGGFTTTYTGFYMSTLWDENLIRPPTGRMDVVSAGGFVPDGPYKDSRIVEWIVPTGNPGDKLDLLFGSGPGPGTGQIHFIYEYGGAGETEPILTKEPETSDTEIEEFEEEEPCIDSGARFSTISKEVEVYHKGDPAGIFSAKPNTILCVGDHIITGEESHTVIIFADLSTLKMRPESEIIINSPELVSTKIDVRKGTLWLKFKKLVLGDAIEVKSNLATTGIRGTTIVYEVAEDEHVLKVIEGEVEFTSLTTGDKEIVSGGETVTATSEGLSGKTTFDVEEESKLWETPKSRNSWFFLVGIIIIGVVAFHFLKKN